MRKSVVFIFALMLSISFAFAYPITGNAIETEDDIIEAGTTPDSFWYGLDVAIDNIDLMLTSKDKKAEKGLSIARERLLEVKAMISENKIEESMRAQKEHEEVLSIIEESVLELEFENETEEIELEVEIEKEIEEHKAEIEKTKEELRLKVKVEGEIDAETQALIDSIISGLENSTGRVEVEVKRKKDETKIKIKTKTGKTEIEIEREFEEYEEREGLSGFSEERALEMREKAVDKWLDVEEKALKYNQEVPDKELFDELISLGNEALDNSSYEEAKDYFEEAKDYAEELKDSFEEFEDEFEEEEIEVEVEVEDGHAEIKVEALGDKIEFYSDKVDREEIIKEISERTGLTIEEITQNLKFEVEYEEDDDFEEEDDEKDDEDKNFEEEDKSKEDLDGADKN